MKPPTIEKILQKLVTEIQRPDDLEAKYDLLKPQLGKAVENDDRLSGTGKSALCSILKGPYRNQSGINAPSRLLESLQASIKDGSPMFSHASATQPQGDSITLDEALESYLLDTLPMAYGIRRYLKNEVTVILPAQIGNRPVTSIAANAFLNRNEIRAVEVSRYVTEIGAHAFSGCSSLEKVPIPESVKVIGSEAFRDCAKITKVVLPDSLRSIGNKAFAGCTALAEVNLPSGITKCGGHLFEGCDELRSLKIPGTFKKIGNALAGCPGIRELAIPDTVKEIGVDAFKNCVGLEKVIIPESVTKIRAGAFDGCNKLRHVVIPSTLEDIDLREVSFIQGLGKKPGPVFSQCAALEKVTINAVSKSPSWLGKSAFDNCRALSFLVLEGDLDQIGEGWFSGLRRIKQVKISAPVTRICDQTFQNCKELKKINIPDSVSNISPTAFADCSKLKELWIDAGNHSFSFVDGVLFDNSTKKLVFCIKSKKGICSITEGVLCIGEKSFSGCTELEVVEIPNSVIEISPQAFGGCSSLQELRINPNNPSYRFIDGVLFDKAMTKLLICVPCKEGSYSIPEGVEEIGSRAFINCDGMKSLIIPKSVSKIAGDAFIGMRLIEHIENDGRTRLERDDSPISLADLIAQNLDD